MVNRNFCPVIKINKIITVVSQNKGKLKICETGSNEGIFLLFIRFPYLKIFDEIPPKVRSHVLKLAFQTIVVKCELTSVVSENKFGPKVSSYNSQEPQIDSFC